MYSYYANNPIIKTLTDEQMEAVYRVRQMQYRVEDIKAHALDMVDNEDLTFPEFAFVCEAAQTLAERYIYKYHDCNMAENDVMVSMISDYCQDHAQEIEEGTRFAYNKPVSPSVLLKVATGKDFPENTSLEQVAEIMNEYGFKNLWDFCLSDMDEAMLNLEDDRYLLPVSFEDPSGGYPFTRIFEITQDMAETLWELLEAQKAIPEWAQDLDEIDQDCVEQYGVLLGRPLESYAEYIEIDEHIDEMILEWEDPEEFFAEYPALEQYRAGGMSFDTFIKTPKSLAMVITVEEYLSVKPLLRESYGDQDIDYIDNYCKFKPMSERFLLCNLADRKQITHPMMYLNAVTFVDRVPFKNVNFSGCVTKQKTSLDAQIGSAAQRSAGGVDMDAPVRDPEH